jgi:hypothetical protein
LISNFVGPILISGCIAAIAVAIVSSSLCVRLRSCQVGAGQDPQAPQVANVLREGSLYL